MKLIDFSTRRPVSVFIFAVAAVVFGMVAFSKLATDLLPDITYPSVTVRTIYAGAAPVEIESLITRPIENAVGVVNNVVRVTSSSRADTSEVTLEFAWGTDMDFAALDVRERLDLIRLPLDAERPILLRYDPSLDPILRIGISGETDLVRLRLIAEERLQRALERIEGVAAVLVSGGLEEEIQVEIDERKMSNLGLSIDRVGQRLAQENVNLTGGRLREGQTEYLVRTVNEFLRPEDIANTVIDRSRGAVVRLRDIGRVFKGHKEREIITRIDGRESVEVAVYKEGGTNTVTVANAVTGSLDSLTEELRVVDPNLDLTVISDQSRYIRQSVNEVLSTAVLGGTLAILVLFFFLRSFKTTMIIGISIPISVVATFFLMYTFGVSLNIMSLGGLTLGIGLLVDNSIVVLEAIQRKRDKGMGEVEAARAGTGEVARAVVASTLTTVCVFAPIVFVEGIAGQLFGDQALTVTFSLIVSLLVALTVIPMLASRRFALAEVGESAAGKRGERGQLPRRGEEEGATRYALRLVGYFLSLAWLAAILYWVALGVGRLVKLVFGGLGRLVMLILAVPLRLFTAAFEGLGRLYERLLKAVLRAPGLTLALSLLLLGGSLFSAGKLGTELIPELIQGELFLDVELPPGTHLEITRRRLEKLEARATRLPGVRTVYTVIGSSNEQGGAAGEKRENLGQVTLTLDPPISRQREEAVMDELRQQLDAQGDLEYRFGRPSYFSFKTPIELEIRGYNLKLLERLAVLAVARMNEIEGLVDVKSSTEGGNPELEIRFKRDRLAALGLNLDAVAAVVRQKVQGTVATEINRDDRTIDIRLRAEEGYRDSVADLRNLVVVQTGKTAIPLIAVADITETIGPAEIRRADSERVALITANLDGRDLGAVADEISAAIAEIPFPAGFDWQLGGQRQEMETSFDSMKMAILLAVFMVYLVMASQFESLLHPFVILLSVPFSVIGVLATLHLFDVAISVVVLIGAILLAGIVVNNAILLIDYTNHLRRERGMAKIAALQQAGRVRLRPILMTTATTVLGLLPMAIGLGEGSELRTPMALTVIGGLIASTALTLLIIPAVYSLLDRGD